MSGNEIETFQKTEKSMSSFGVVVTDDDRFFFSFFSK